MKKWGAKFCFGSIASALILLAIPALCYGQKGRADTNKNQISATTTNDNFLPPIQDYYYTNGINLGYSRLIENDHFLSQIIPRGHRKTILRFKIGQQIYTPNDIESITPAGMDHPYAGYLYLKTTLDNFWGQSKNLQFSLTTGVIGPASGAEGTQKKWHRWFNFQQPEGWRYQIQNMAVINLGTQYRRSFSISQHIDVIPKAGFRVGTAFNDISAGVKVRLGHINPIDHSAVAGSRIGSAGNQDGGSNNWYFFLGIYNRLVLHNALIEGKLVSSNTNRFTPKTKPYLLTMNGGLAFSLPSVSWRLIMKQLSREIVDGKSHNIVSLKMTLQF